MKKIIKKNSYFIILLCFCTVLSCSSNAFIGIGNEVDTEAPSLKILSHSNLDFVAGTFTLSGSCVDNVQVTKVVIKESVTQKQWSPNVNDNTWSQEITLTDGEYEFYVYAFDARGNSSNQSYKSITLTVDTELPVSQISYPTLFTNLNDIKSLDYHNFDYIDYFHNNTFKIKGAVDENFKMKSIKLALMYEGGEVFSRTITNGEPLPSGVTGSVWNYEVSVDSVNDISYPSGVCVPDEKYYMNISLTATDMSGNVASSSAGYICIYQNSDIPWTSVSSTTEGDMVAAGGIISGNAYDDDGLSKIYIKIAPIGETVNFSDYKDFSVSLAEKNVSEVVIDKSTDKPRMFTWKIKVPETPGNYKLYAVASDVNGVIDNKYETIEFVIPDADTPLTTITSHTDQQEEIGDANGDFTIEGYSYDNIEVAKTYIAWVPTGVDGGIMTAKSSWIKNGTENSWYNDKIRIYDITGTYSSNTEDATITPDFGIKWKKTWKLPLNANTDFTEYSDKTFMIYTEDTNGNYSVSRFHLAKDSVSPVITITAPSKDGLSFQNSSTANFDIKGTASDNSKIKEITATWEEGGVTAAASYVNGVWNINSSSLGLTAGAQNVQIKATDIYGNSAYLRRYLIIDNNNPRVTNVTSTHPNYTYTTGNTITVSVEFNKNVKVETLTPRILLDIGTGVYADYISGSGSNTLVFSYTVASGHNTGDLEYKGVDSLSGGKIVANETGNAVILTLPVPGEEGSLSYNKQIVIDTASPTINLYSPVQNGIDVKSQDDWAGIKLTFSESVFRESGSIEIVRVVNSLPIVMTVDEYNEYISALTVAGKTTETASLKAAYKLTTNGVLSTGIVDTTAKYVLRYDRGLTDVTLRPIFDDLGYNKTVIPVDSTQVTGSGTNTITIKPASRLPIGVEYYVTIPATAFRDSVSNSFAGIQDNTTYRFTTGPVATPVIRINKISANGYIGITALTTEFRVDCESDGATVYYGVNGSSTTTDSALDYADPAAPVTFSTSGSKTLGDNVYAKGWKYYIQAYAQKTGLTTSATAGEKAFRTVMSATNKWFRGSNNSGGPTTAPGFPIRWEDNAVGYIRQGVQNGNYYFITWEINQYTHFKALSGGDMMTRTVGGTTYEAGPASYGWGAGANRNVYPGCYKFADHASYEALAARQGDESTWIYRVD